MNEGLSVPASAIQARGVLPYTSHIGMSRPPQRVGFLRRYGLKTGIDFPQFGPESKIGYGFPGNFESVRKYLLFQFQMSSKEREICQFEMAFKKSFLLLF